MVTCYVLTHGMTSHYVSRMAQQDSIVLSLRLPAKLVKRLDTLAERELRTRVNMIHVLLQEALDSREQGK
jgi:metal-responsive CopG/Arc/MetJ family transcriptional regulator